MDHARNRTRAPPVPRPCCHFRLYATLRARVIHRGFPARHLPGPAELHHLPFHAPLIVSGYRRSLGTQPALTDIDEGLHAHVLPVEQRAFRGTAGGQPAIPNCCVIDSICQVALGFGPVAQTGANLDTVKTITDEIRATHGIAVDTVIPTAEAWNYVASIAYGTGERPHLVEYNTPNRNPDEVQGTLMSIHASWGK